MEILVIGVLAVATALVFWNIRIIRSKLIAFTESGSAEIDIEDFESLMELELQRARRLNYPLSVIMFRIKRDLMRKPSPSEVLRFIAGDSRAVRLTDQSPDVVNIFRNAPEPVVRMRSTDTAVYDRERNRFVMMLVGSKREDAERIAKRISTDLQEDLGLSVNYGCAEFPRDRYFIQDLMADAELESHSVESGRSGSRPGTVEG